MNAYCTSGSSPSLKRIFATLVTLLLAVSLVACGGGKSIGSNQPPQPPSPSPAPVADPQGNWVLTMSDTSGHTSEVDVYLQQSGSTVTSTNLSVPINSDCVPFLHGSLVNGLVQNFNHLSGQIDLQGTTNEAPFSGSFDFSGTLAQDDLSFTGTYSNMPACLNVAPTGTITGRQVPDASGTWQGTLTPCTYDSTNGQCSPNGQPSTTFSMTITQDNAGGIKGSYSVTNMAPLSSGTLAGGVGGHFTSFQMTDQQNCSSGCGVYGFSNQYYGSLGFDRTLTGVLSGPTGYNQYGYWLVSASH